MPLRRVLFAPNLHDASPRVLAEAMCLNVPILVNRHILGGWKYVNDQTGAFFDNEDDVVGAFKGILAAQAQGRLQPRGWYKCEVASGRLAWVSRVACLSIDARMDMASICQGLLLANHCRACCRGMQGRNRPLVCAWPNLRCCMPLQSAMGEGAGDAPAAGVPGACCRHGAPRRSAGDGVRQHTCAVALAWNMRTLTSSRTRR